MTSVLPEFVVIRPVQYLEGIERLCAESFKEEKPMVAQKLLCASRWFGLLKCLPVRFSTSSAFT